MLGKEGAINDILLMGLHVISQPIDALLFTELSVVIGMTQIYCVFMVGPIAFMLGRIDHQHHRSRAGSRSELLAHRSGPSSFP